MAKKDFEEPIDDPSNLEDDTHEEDLPEIDEQDTPKSAKAETKMASSNVPSKKKKKKKHKVQAEEKAEKSNKGDKGRGEKKPAKSKSSKIWVIAIILIIIAGGLAVVIWKTNSKKDTTCPANPVLITEYSDFQCPFCKQAEGTVVKLKELYGCKIQVEYKHFPLEFHVNAVIAAEASECARDQGKFQEYHDVLFAKGQGDGTGLAAADLKKYAADMQLDTAKFNTCLDSGVKKTVVAAQQAEGASKGVEGTPAFFIGTEMISGAQPIENFIKVIDKALGSNSSMIDTVYKDEPAVELTVLNDKNCGAECSSAQIIAVSKQLFPKTTVTEVDIASDEGKALVQKYGVVKVPTYIFSSNLVLAAKYRDNPNLAAAFQKVDDKYKILDEQTGATRFVDPEKQKEYEALLAAKAAEAKKKLGIGEKPQIDFFTMSYCPYGNQAEEAIEKAYKVIGDKAVFKPRQVIYSNYRGGGANYCLDAENKYCSMHGNQELNQDIREECVYNDFGTRAFFDFALAMNAKCSASNADSCWTQVAKDLKLDTDKIAACEKAKGVAYSQANLDLNTLLSVQGSPTVFVNGKLYEGARTPEGFLSAICDAFTDRPSECSQVPEQVAASTTPQGSC
jgi:protein-disulfide isomerase